MDLKLIIPQLVTIIVAALSSGGLWAFLQNRRTKDSLERQALTALLHDSIYKDAREAVERGFVTADSLNNLERMYKPYVAMGGNGTAKKLIEKARELPLISPDDYAEYLKTKNEKRLTD